MIQSTELAFRNSYRQTGSYPDWSPVYVDFPKGVKPRTYKNYTIGEVLYKIAIPQWGEQLNPRGWYYGLHGLWHKDFNSIPFYLGTFDEGIRERINNDFYFKELKHRLWAYGDHVVTELDAKELEYLPIGYEFCQTICLETLMKNRRYLYHERPLRLAESKKVKFLKPTKTLEAQCKFNKRSLAKELRIEPVPRLRRLTMDEIRTKCVKLKSPVPIFDKKGFWINEPNPEYCDTVPIAQAIGKDLQVSIPVNKPGRGHRLNQKLIVERRKLLSILCVPIFRVKRHHLRWLRSLRDHLNNIVLLSEHIRVCFDPRRRKKMISDIHRLVKTVPFTTFGSAKSPPASFATLPPWARRIVTRNLWFPN